MKQMASDTYAAVRSGKLAQPFDAAMAGKACPRWARSYPVFLPKHEVSKHGNDTKLFRRVRPGWYTVL